MRSGADPVAGPTVVAVPTGGIIFLTILALWAFYLVPVLVKERAARLDSRAGDRTSPAVRVLQRPPTQRPSHRVVLTADRPVVSDDLPARPTPDLAVRLRAQARTARVGVHARAVAAVVGAVALLVAGTGTGLGLLPGWTAGVAGAWFAAVVLSGAVAASGRRRAVATPVGRAATLPPRAHRVATEVFDGRVARLSAGVPPAITSAATSSTTYSLAARTALADRSSTWLPVQVPGPVYASKPVSHRPPALPWSMPPAAADEVLGEADVDLRDGPDDGRGYDAAATAREAEPGVDGKAHDQADDQVQERRSASA